MVAGKENKIKVRFFSHTTLDVAGGKKSYSMGKTYISLAEFETYKDANLFEFDKSPENIQKLDDLKAGRKPEGNPDKKVDKKVDNKGKKTGKGNGTDNAGNTGKKGEVLTETGHSKK